jgi:hypothetical protein
MAITIQDKRQVDFKYAQCRLSSTGFDHGDGSYKATSRISNTIIKDWQIVA